MYLHSDRNECNYEGKWELQVIERYEESPIYRASRAHKRQEGSTITNSVKLHEVRNTVVPLLDQPGGAPRATEGEEAVETEVTS